MKLLLLAAGLLCLIAVARGSDDEQLVREVVKSFVTDYNNGDFKNAMLRGVSITTESMTVRFVTHDVALVNAIHKSDTYVTPEDGVKHENERQMKTYVVIKHNGKWLLALDQNTIIYNP